MRNSTAILIAVLGVSTVVATSLITANNPRAAIQGVDTSSSRGYLTSIKELQNIKAKASGQFPPYYPNTLELLSDYPKESGWKYGTTGGNFYPKINSEGRTVCASDIHPEGDPVLDESAGAADLYALAIAYQLSGDVGYGEIVRNVLLDLTDTTYFGGSTFSGSNECILHLAFGIPHLIQAADLLEGSEFWSTADKLQFQEWLIQEAYPKVAWASRVRKNNWGSAGSLASSMIADYTFDSRKTLTEVSPVEKSLTASEAYSEHNEMQKQRLSTTWKGDSQCEIYGLQPYGGIPDELRRGTTGCTGMWVNEGDSSLSYQVLHVNVLIYHAEYLLHRGDPSLYNYFVGDSAAIPLAINFVLNNPTDITKSREWKSAQRGALYVAYRYFRDTNFLTEANQSNYLKDGNVLPFGKLTHSFSPGEEISLPPVTLAPTAVGLAPEPVTEDEVIVMFTAKPRKGTLPLRVQFTDLTTGPVYSRRWRFGNRTHSVRRNPIVTYKKKGIYTVSLTINGTKTLKKVGFIIVR